MSNEGNLQTYKLSRILVSRDMDSYAIHKHVWKGFDARPGTPQPFVFRRSASTKAARPGNPSPQTGDVSEVLVQSASAPDSSALGLAPQDVRTCRVPAAGEYIAFGMRVQAITRSSGKASGTGPRQRSIGDPRQLDIWITEHLQRAGLMAEDFWTRQDAVVEAIAGNTVNTYATWVEGHASVLDQGALSKALVCGVGRGRCMGFGMLSLARP